MVGYSDVCSLETSPNILNDSLTLKRWETHVFQLGHLGLLSSRGTNRAAKMDAIKKKMQAMKLEKDNAMDRALLCEQQARDANLRAEKAEEEARALQKKIQQIENDLDQTQEQLGAVNTKLEDKDKALQLLWLALDVPPYMEQGEEAFVISDVLGASLVGDGGETLHAPDKSWRWENDRYTKT
uniref:Uncharacterized protein n=1 Tax=Timema monikensis TaxID=170555 RepID=A0A7R9DYC7_9NEOP|nr:unnamed protein product [Timema monikensis]